MQHVEESQGAVIKAQQKRMEGKGRRKNLGARMEELKDPPGQHTEGFEFSHLNPWPHESNFLGPSPALWDTPSPSQHPQCTACWRNCTHPMCSEARSLSEPRSQLAPLQLGSGTNPPRGGCPSGCVLGAETGLKFSHPMGHMSVT